MNHCKTPLQSALPWIIYRDTNGYTEVQNRDYQAIQRFWCHMGPEMINEITVDGSHLWVAAHPGFNERGEISDDYLISLNILNRLPGFNNEEDYVASLAAGCSSDRDYITFNGLPILHWFVTLVSDRPNELLNIPVIATAAELINQNIRHEFSDRKTKPSISQATGCDADDLLDELENPLNLALLSQVGISISIDANEVITAVFHDHLNEEYVKLNT